MIPYSTQEIDNKDIQSVIKVLKSKTISRGKKINEFEKKFSKFTNSKYSVAINSATSGLHLACKSLGIDKNSVVWVPANSFVATANCVRYCGANVDFLDINLEDFNLDLEKLKIKLILAKKNNKSPQVIIPVHFCGNPYDQKELFALSKKYGFKIIEDASHAVGSLYEGKKVGSCKWSDISVFSFHPVKIMTTGEGGMITTNNKKYYEKIKMLRSHGITREKKFLTNKKNESWYYEQKILGYNYWITDFQAALGINQLKKVNQFVKKRNVIAQKYIKSFKDENILLQKVKKKLKSSYHLFVIRYEFIKSRIEYSKIFKSFIKSGIGVNLHYLPIYWHPYYKRLGFKKGYCKNAEKYATSSFSLPIFTSLKPKQQKKIIAFVKKIAKIKK
jgi:UDP-4-amino-4,6-dideoxy-N-acetyl-beta-L-altrosamine transaminase